MVNMYISIINCLNILGVELGVAEAKNCVMVFAGLDDFAQWADVHA